MRLLDRLNDNARRLMLAPLVVFGFASIIATGGEASAAITARLAWVPERAPSRSTTCSQDAPSAR